MILHLTLILVKEHSHLILLKSYGCFLKYDWMGDAAGNPIHVWQTRANGTKNVIGEISNPIRTGNNVVFELKCQNALLKTGLDYTFASKGNYDNTFVLADADISNEL